MTWARLDDSFYDHPKFLGLGLEPIGLWACGLAYACRYLTDGFLPRAAVARFGGPKGIKTASELVDSGLWSEVNGGYSIINYLEYNQSKSNVESTRKVKQDAGKRGASARSRSHVPAQAEPKQLLEQSLSSASTSAQPPSHPIPSHPDPPIPPGGVAAGPESVPPETSDSELERDREDDYREAYEAGIAAGKGVERFAMPRKQAGELHQAMLAYARGGKTGKLLRGPRCLEWIRVFAEEFARWLAKEARDKPQMAGFYSGYGPTGFLKWLNEQNAEDIP